MTTIRIPVSELQACPVCDLLLARKRAEAGARTRCPRCKTVIRKIVGNSLEKAMAMSLAGLILFVPAVFMPIMTFSVAGLHGSGNMFDAVMVLFTEGYFFVGIMVLLVSIVFPFLKLSLLFISSISIFSGRISSTAIKTLRLYRHLSEWGMVEVYLLGILVSIVKMYSMADIHYNSGFFCFIGLVLFTVGSSAVTDNEYFWDRVEAKMMKKKGQQSPVITLLSPRATAREAGLVRCESCGKVARAVHIADDELMRCRRCLSPLHLRKPDSIGRTWAFVLTACVLFLPANILPIMRVDFMGTSDESTILDGIIYFFQDGDYFIGGIILIASVLVPLFKIVGMFILLFGLHFQRHNWLKQKTRMFAAIEFIGRWSFLDIFVIALLAALVQFGALTTIAASPAAPFFTAVVITSMFAALAFDPRILWDAAASHSKNQERTCLIQS